MSMERTSYELMISMANVQKAIAVSKDKKAVPKAKLKSASAK